MKRLTLIALTLLVVGCSERNPYETKTTRFLVTNYFQYDEVQIEIDDKKTTGFFKKPIFAGLAENFTVDILVPKPPENAYTRNSFLGPTSNSNDWETNISVRFRITRTGEATSWLTCRAGAKITTRVYIKAIAQNRVETGCDVP